MSTEISGKMSAINVTPTITAGAYTAGKQIGGLLTFTRAFGIKQSGILHGLVIRDKGKQSSAIDIVLFSQLPAGAFTDASTFNPSAADFALIQGVVSVLATDYASFSAQSLATKAGIGLPIKNTTVDNPATGTQGSPNLGLNLYAALVARGTPTYASTSDLTVVADILED